MCTCTVHVYMIHHILYWQVLLMYLYISHVSYTYLVFVQEFIFGQYQLAVFFNFDMHTHVHVLHVLYSIDMYKYIGIHNCMYCLMSILLRY